MFESGSIPEESIFRFKGLGKGLPLGGGIPPFIFREDTHFPLGTCPVPLSWRGSS